MKFGNINVSIDSKIEELLDNAINMDSRNIVVLGQTGTGKSVILNHLVNICKNNKNILNGVYTTDIKRMLEDNELNNSMCALGGIKTTAVLDEFNSVRDGYKLVVNEYKSLYANYIIALNCGYGDEIELFDKVNYGDLISVLNPIIIKTDKEFCSNNYTLEFIDNGESILKSRVYREDK